LEPLVDHVLRVPSSQTARIQECHILLGHLLCAHVETQLFAHLKDSPGSGLAAASPSRGPHPRPGEAGSAVRARTDPAHFGR
jgi:hypothetical protein